MREKLWWFVFCGVGSRITPASAGKTSNIDYRQILAQGSPPRVREKPCTWLLSPKEPGITPASAGKTLKDPIEIANPD